MRLLAIESSAVTASVAILTDDVLTAEYTVNYKKTHSQTLLPMIDEICRMTQTTPQAIDLIAVSVGPGSFTGLRIGAATGKGIALATKKNMVAVPTLEAMAYNLQNVTGLICPVMDAKRQHLYTGIYRFNESGELETVMKQSLLSYDELVDIINEKNEVVSFLGDGVNVARECFEKKLKCSYKFAGPNLNTQRASSVAVAASVMAKKGLIVTAEALRPDYLRPSQAERERKEK